MEADPTRNWSQEAEQSALGCLLIDNNCYALVIDIIRADDFFERRNAAIFQAISALVESRRAADTVTVNEQLKDRGEPDIDIQYLEALGQCVPGAAQVRQYAEIIAEKAAQRRVLATADAAMSIASGDGTAQEKLDKIATSFVRLERNQQRRAPQRIGDLLGSALDRYDALADGKVASALPTGIKALDRLCAGGLRPGRLYGIAARPSVGKSSAARSMLLNVTRTGAPVLLLSQEMPNYEVLDALVSQAGRIDGIRLQTGQLADEDWGRMVEATTELQRLPLYLDDQGALTLAQVRRKARQVKGLKLLALDYLQLCSGTRKDRSTNDEIAEISRGLKALALEMDIPIIVLSQLNREVERREDKEPVLADLRDSGAIEQDLDVAILLWTAREAEESRLVGWKVAKNRSGAKGTFAMRWSPATNLWLHSDEALRSQPRNQTGGFR